MLILRFCNHSVSHISKQPKLRGPSFSTHPSRRVWKLWNSLSCLIHVYHMVDIAIMKKNSCDVQESSPVIFFGILPPEVRVWTGWKTFVIIFVLFNNLVCKTADRFSSATTSYWPYNGNVSMCWITTCVINILSGERIQKRTRMHA